MGILQVDAVHLVEGRSGQTGGSAVMLGRLNMLLHRADVRALRQLVGSDPVAQAWFDDYEWGTYADGFFRDVLRFDAVASIDFSPDEGATIVHDLGTPLPPELVGTFDLVVDGGTLEHVFDFPTAIGNLMRLVKVGGLVYLNGPCNNLCGHGFYQYSPELMFRIFSASNGFEVEFVRLAKARYVEVGLTSRQPVYDAVDPLVSGERTNLITSDPVMILTMARRVCDCEPFEASMLQSDYMPHPVAAQAPRTSLRGLKTAARGLFPRSSVTRHAVGLYGRHKASLRYRPAFRRVRPGRGPGPS